MKEVIEAALEGFAKRIAVFVLICNILIAIGFFVAGYWFGSQK